MFLRGISMKKLIEILRLHYDGNLSQRQIEKSINVSRKTINYYLILFDKSGLSWPLDKQYQNDDLLSQALKPGYVSRSTHKIDFITISKELRQGKHLTLQLLWEERVLRDSSTCSYSNFALLYRKWLGTQPSYMRQAHKAGEKVFVDYSGDKVTIIDTDTGKLREAEIFVGVMGASNYTYLEATWSQSLSDWTMSHVRMFEHLGGVPQLVIPDNLRSAVSKAHRYDPDITPAYYHMLAHYGSAAMPARAYRPKDKASAENGVLIVQRWILAKLRHEQIYGLAALNARLGALMEIANTKKFKRYPDCRRDLFNEIDKPCLRPLPSMRYTYREYKRVRVSGDYHVELSRHNYSVPYQLIGEEIDMWYTSSLVEFYHKNTCVAKHVRSNLERSKTTVTEHMPRSHKEYAGLSVEKMQEWAQKIGASTVMIVEYILQAAPHKEVGCKRSHGFLNLSKKYSDVQLEAACSYALNRGIKNYEYIEVIIKQHIREQQVEPLSAIPIHNNIRGSEQYH
jgi:transposase